MSAELVISTLLSAAGSVTAIVSERIYPDFLPESKAAPALVYRVVSDVPHDDVAQAQVQRTRRARVQVDAIASSDAYAVRKALLVIVRQALHGQIGTIAGIVGVVVRELITGPDLPHERAGLSSSSIDFQVVYQQAA